MSSGDSASREPNKQWRARETKRRRGSGGVEERLKRRSENKAECSHGCSVFSQDSMGTVNTLVEGSDEARRQRGEARARHTLTFNTPRGSRGIRNRDKAKRQVWSSQVNIMTDIERPSIEPISAKYPQVLLDMPFFIIQKCGYMCQTKIWT